MNKPNPPRVGQTLPTRPGRPNIDGPAGRHHWQAFWTRVRIAARELQAEEPHSNEEKQ